MSTFHKQIATIPWSLLLVVAVLTMIRLFHPAVVSTYLINALFSIAALFAVFILITQKDE